MITYFKNILLIGFLFLFFNLNTVNGNQNNENKCILNGVIITFNDVKQIQRTQKKGSPLVCTISLNNGDSMKVFNYYTNSKNSYINSREIAENYVILSGSDSTQHLFFDFHHILGIFYKIKGGISIPNLYTDKEGKKGFMMYSESSKNLFVIAFNLIEEKKPHEILDMIEIKDTRINLMDLMGFTMIISFLVLFPFTLKGVILEAKSRNINIILCTIIVFGIGAVLLFYFYMVELSFASFFTLLLSFGMGCSIIIYNELSAKKTKVRLRRGEFKSYVYPYIITNTSKINDIPVLTSKSGKLVRWKPFPKVCSKCDFKYTIYNSTSAQIEIGKKQAALTDEQMMQLMELVKEKGCIAPLNCCIKCGNTNDISLESLKYYKKNKKSYNYNLWVCPKNGIIFEDLNNNLLDSEYGAKKKGESNNVCPICTSDCLPIQSTIIY